MLRFFEGNCRLNWVDSNNVFVGFDDEGDCCEVWGGDFYDGLDRNARKLDVDLTVDNDWVFDTSFHADSDDVDVNLDDYEAATAGFRLVNRNGDVMYLVIWNSHNGYYVHSFDFCNGETVIVSGSI
jgi:hypothetical protein